VIGVFAVDGACLGPSVLSRRNRPRGFLGRVRRVDDVGAVVTYPIDAIFD